MCEKTEVAERIISVTLEQIMAWVPCPDYPRERVEELMAGRAEITPDEISELDLDADSILWALLHQEFLQDFDMRELACDFAERLASARGCTPALEFVSKIRAWNRGEIADDDFEELMAEYWAANWAAYYWGSDWAAYWSADRAAYWDAHEAACGAAYWAACGADDTQAERRWQIQHTLERIREGK